MQVAAVTVIQIVRESLSLLQRRDRWKLGLITVVQMATGFLDLIGVLFRHFELFLMK